MTAVIESFTRADEVELRPLALSTDEIRAAARVAGVSPLPVFDSGWAPDELSVGDAVALRGLLAHGLAAVREVARGPEVVLTKATRTVLEPLLRPRTSIEVVRNASVIETRRYLVAEAAGATVIAEEREPSIWMIRPTAECAESTVLPIVATMLEQVQSERPEGSVIVSAETLARAETLIDQGGQAILPDMLSARGMSTEAVAVLSRLLPAVRAAVTIRVLRRLGTSSLETSELVWKDAGTLGLWLAEPEPPAAGDDPDLDDPETAPAVVLTPTGQAEIQAALNDILDMP